MGDLLANLVHNSKDFGQNHS